MKMEKFELHIADITWFLTKVTNCIEVAEPAHGNQLLDALLLL